MRPDANATQESRTERVAAAITPTAKRALEEVARDRGTTVSKLLHQISIEEAVEEWEQLKDSEPDDQPLDPAA